MDERRIKHIEFWQKSAEENFKSMQNIFLAGEYMWSLFIGHLAIEKYLKAVYVKNNDLNVPRIHDLYKLALKFELSMTEEMKDKLQLITTFNIEARYDLKKEEIYSRCTREYTEKILNQIKGIREWLLKMLNN